MILANKEVAMKKASGRPKAKTVDFALRDLLAAGKAGTQEEIAIALKKEGYSVNQTKISRLLHKMGAIKVVNENGQSIYRLPHEHGLMHEVSMPTHRLSVKELVLDIAANAMMIVIHTTPGAAGFVAREIDLHQMKLDILGTLAGDDTIFIAPRDTRQIHRVMENIKNHFG